MGQQSIAQKDWFVSDKIGMALFMCIMELINKASNFKLWLCK